MFYNRIMLYSHIMFYSRIMLYSRINLYSRISVYSCISWYSRISLSSRGGSPMQAYPGPAGPVQDPGIVVLFCIIVSACLVVLDCLGVLACLVAGAVPSKRIPLLRIMLFMMFSATRPDLTDGTRPWA